MTQEQLPYLPSTPGVYQFKNKSGSMLYIGKAKDLSKRVRQYFSPGSIRKIDMVHQAYTLEYIQTQTEEEALLLEEQLIKQYRPPYNSLLKHNSNYVWIKYSKELFPKVSIVRKRRSDGATYIGPKQRNRSLYKLMKYIRRIYKYRTMPTTQFRMGTLDMDFHLGLDEGRSVINKLGIQNKKTGKNRTDVANENKIDISKTKEEWAKEYQVRLKDMRALLEGHTDTILDHLQQEIIHHTGLEHYERCAQLAQAHEYISTRDDRHQSVVLHKPRSGYVCWIELTASHHIVIMIKLTEGKIIDIIRTKHSIQDQALDSLINEISVEFEVQPYDHYDSPHRMFLCSAGYIRISKQDKQNLQEVHQRVLDSYIASHSIEKESIMNELLMSLHKRYNLDRVPYHIECIDISHLSGDYTSGGLSSFIAGLPNKKGYRQYKISEAHAGDDYASLAEVIIRRFELQKGNKSRTLPDIFVLDGGKGQLGVIKQLLEKYPNLQESMKTTQFISLGKGSARSRRGKQAGHVEYIYTFDDTMDIQNIPLIYDQADRIWIHLRDEAHRFANRYRKNRKSGEFRSQKQS